MKKRSAVPATDYSPGYEELHTFIMKNMSLQHVYQPILIKTVLAGGGAATLRQVAAAFLAADLSQLEYYEKIALRHPTDTLKRRHGIVDYANGIYRLPDRVQDLTEWERAALIAMCEARLAEYIASRQDAIWSHRAGNTAPVQGSLRYDILARAHGRCEACGVSSEIEAIQVDHIVPRAKGGSNDPTNLQALCGTCNAQKRERDTTDFHSAHVAYDVRTDDCIFCDIAPERVREQNRLAVAIEDAYPVTSGHMLIIPKRHVADQTQLWQPDVNAIFALQKYLVDQLRSADPSITGFNIGSNAGYSAGQTIFHCHIHLIPRRDGDMQDPRGGIRGVIPEKRIY